MALTPSTMLPIGTPLPPFRLPDPEGRVTDSAELAGRPLLVAFLCNHCPYVKHIADGVAAFGRDYEGKGLAIVAINSNDAEAYPDDAPPKMAEEAKRRGYRFPYLYDGTQAVAKAFRAACTPEFYLFDASGTLAYRGQFDGSRPGNGIAVTGTDLRTASDAILAGRPAAADQKPSVGCNIKWKPGSAPEWF
jgi:thiol-disulfide isomerase/thioredoxin